MDDEQDATQRLVTAHLELARAVAARYFQHDPTRDEDLVQVAYIGLIKAARRYRPSRGGFVAYALPTIAGEVKRHLRDHGWMVRPPRARQELNRRIASAVPELTQQLRRTPTRDDLALELGATPDEVTAAGACDGCLRPLSLDVQVGDSSTPLSELIADESSHEAEADRRVTVWAALRTLAPRERTIVYLRFFEELPQQAIADRLGISQMHVSRILRRTLGQLHLAIGA